MRALTDRQARGARPAGERSPWLLAGALVAGVLGILAIVLTQEASRKTVFVSYAVAAFIVLLPLIGNVRAFSYYCLLAFAPLELRMTFLSYPHLGGAAALLIELVDPFLAILLFFQLRDWIRGERSVYRFPRALALSSALIVLGLGNVVFGPLRIVSLLEVVRMCKLLLLTLVLVNEIVRRRQFRHAVLILLGGVILQAVVALIQNVKGAQLGLQFLGESTDEETQLLSATSLEGGKFAYRAGGLIGHANLLAALLALFLPTAVALLLAPVSRILKLVSVVALAVGTPALLLTLSRTGWTDFVVGIVVALAAGAMHPVSRRRFLVARVAIVAGSIIAGIAAAPVIATRLYQAEPTSVEYRIKWLKTAWAMIVDHPVFGVGLNSYVYRQLPYGELKSAAEMANFYGDIWPVVHNSWLIVWSEQGTVGFALWVAFHLAIIGIGVGNLKLRDPLMHALNAGLLAGFLAIMVDGLASFFVRQDATGRMYWIAVALILAIDYWRRVNEQGVPAVPAPGTAPDPPADAPEGGRWLPDRGRLLQ